MSRVLFYDLAAVHRSVQVSVAEAIDRVVSSGQFILVEAARVAITDRTTAIVAVHLFGSFSPVDQLGALARSAGIALVEDAAQAHGATWDGHKPGTGSAFAACSFYPSKNLGAYGDGVAKKEACR